MKHDIKNEHPGLPNEKKDPPLGKRVISMIPRLNNFPIGTGLNQQLLLTTVSDRCRDQLADTGKSTSEAKSASVNLLHQETASGADVCRKDAVWIIKVFLN